MKVAFCHWCKSEMMVKRRFARNYCCNACKQSEYRSRLKKKWGLIMKELKTDCRLAQVFADNGAIYMEELPL